MSILKIWGDFNKNRQALRTYLSRIRKDGGALAFPELSQKLYDLNRPLESVTKLMWSAVGAISPRVSGVNTFTQKGYDMGKLGNDLTQTTAAYQPDFSRIAPVERGGLMNANGQTKFMTFPTITKLATDKWTIELGVNWNGSNGARNSILGKNSDTLSTLSFRDTTLNRFAFRNESGTEVAGATGGTNSIIGKNTILHFTAAGDGTLKIYKNGVWLETLTVATNSIFTQIIKAISTAGSEFYGKVFDFEPIDKELSESEVINRFSLKRQIYPEIDSVPIGTQTWAVRNFEAVCSAMGNLIPEVQLAATWATSQTLYDNAYAAQSGTTEQKTYAAVKAAAMWSHYNNDAALGAIYGKLYNWFAVKLIQMDIDYYNAANPNALWGWRVPAQADFTTLQTYLGGASVAGGKLKALGTSYWATPNTGATNEVGFTGLGCGRRLDSDGVFASINNDFASWLISENGNNASRLYMETTNTSINSTETSKKRGYSLRLIKT